MKKCVILLISSLLTFQNSSFGIKDHSAKVRSSRVNRCYKKIKNPKCDDPKFRFGLRFLFWQQILRECGYLILGKNLKDNFFGDVLRSSTLTSLFFKNSPKVGNKLVDTVKKAEVKEVVFKNKNYDFPSDDKLVDDEDDEDYDVLVYDGFDELFTWATPPCMYEQPWGKVGASYEEADKCFEFKSCDYFRNLARTQMCFERALKEHLGVDSYFYDALRFLESAKKRATEDTKKDFMIDAEIQEYCSEFEFCHDDRFKGVNHNCGEFVSDRKINCYSYYYAALKWKRVWDCYKQDVYAKAKYYYCLAKFTGKNDDWESACQSFDEVFAKNSDLGLNALYSVYQLECRISIGDRSKNDIKEMIRSEIENLNKINFPENALSKAYLSEAKQRANDLLLRCQ